MEKNIENEGPLDPRIDTRSWEEFIAHRARGRIGIIMGSRSDWDDFMEHAVRQLDDMGMHDDYEVRIISAHRMTHETIEYGDRAVDRGLKVIVAGAGKGVALPGMIAGCTPLPVVGAPAKTSDLGGMDSLLSIVQMPGGNPVGAMTIGKAGAQNSTLYAAKIIGLDDAQVRAAVVRFMRNQTETVRNDPDPRAPKPEVKPQ